MPDDYAGDSSTTKRIAIGEGIASVIQILAPLLHLCVNESETIKAALPDLISEGVRFYEYSL
jgi:hypothetical protein